MKQLIRSCWIFWKYDDTTIRKEVVMTTVQYCKRRLAHRDFEKGKEVFIINLSTV